MWTILVSCDPVVSNNYVIENQSSLELNALLKIVDYFDSDSILIVQIAPSTKATLFTHMEIGKAFDKRDYFLETFDKLLITHNKKHLLKNINSRDNWNFKVIQNGLFEDEVEYKIIFKDKDFE